MPKIDHITGNKINRKKEVVKCTSETSCYLQKKIYAEKQKLPKPGIEPGTFRSSV